MIWDLGNDTVEVILRVPRVDGLGQRVVDSYGRGVVDEVPTTVEGAAVELLSSNEAQSNVRASVVRAHICLPWGIEVYSTSAIRWRGITFEVHGPPRPWTDLDGVGSHIELDAQAERG